MQRFFLDQPLNHKALVIQDEISIHQIMKVLRGSKGDNFTFFNGGGTEYIFQLTEISGKPSRAKKLTFQLQSQTENTCIPSKDITLIQAIPNKIDKMEYVIQKGTEIGVSNFIFFRADRSQKTVFNEKKIARFQKIIIEAAEQCGSAIIPSLTIQEGVPNITGMSLILDPLGSPLSQNTKLIQSAKKINILIGPEGGWTEGEVHNLTQKSMTPISCGKHIMRTETAGVCMGFFCLHSNT